MKLGQKLFLGFIIPPLMLLVAGAWSYQRLNELGAQMQRMLDRNLTSINACSNMRFSVDSILSNVLLAQASNHSELEGIGLIDSSFTAELKVVGERKVSDRESTLIDTLGVRYALYMNSIHQAALQHDPEWVQESVMPARRAVIDAINEVNAFHLDRMYETSKRINSQAYRASLPAAIMVGAAILFTLMFAYLVQVYVVRPIRQLVRALEQWKAGDRFSVPSFETGDEIEQIVNQLKRISARRKGEGLR